MWSGETSPTIFCPECLREISSKLSECHCVGLIDQFSRWLIDRQAATLQLVEWVKLRAVFIDSSVCLWFMRASLSGDVNFNHNSNHARKSPSDEASWMRRRIPEENWMTKRKALERRAQINQTLMKSNSCSWILIENSWLELWLNFPLARRRGKTGKFMLFALVEEWFSEAKVFWPEIR